MNFKKQLLAVAISILAASPAWATNGYFMHGVGQKAKGMGGAGVAFSQDALAGGVNPAGMVHQGNRLEVGADLFRPTRSSTHPSYPGVDVDGNQKQNFLIPEIGYNRMLNDNLSLGVSIFGNGGMNTSYDRPMFSLVGRNSGIDMVQAYIVPTLSWKMNEDHSFGVGLNLVSQSFSAKGIDQFAGLSSNPGLMTDRGKDWATGYGLRLGWQGKISDTVTLGATYQSKTRMEEFEGYAGLFAEQGDFDIPENYALGIAVAATPELTVAFDVMRINYGDVRSIANLETEGGPLGADNSAGFGWKNQTVYKLGLAYDYSDDLTLRAGINHAKSPIPSSQTQFNVLAPATVENHLTLGATWKMDSGMEVSAHYMHAFEKEIRGTAAPFDIKMHQDSFGVSVAWEM
ncbi:OmpP1/FadL family transporter [Solemya velesiana gill symbiont]|uniref:Long-chain fatty acid transporter n=1 Tax=Solemya velesiana gill symbiont TaxID=1918948 RepID=A0A1T2KY38_9GAMM|nr:outer membrane protein transport protein [Solemya velesiana gill symbiont]OOZ37769.1 hypothetical protein BOW51_00440 [Solemya velesiana gill symbiont]